MLSLLVSLVAFAQDATVKGKVTYANSSEGVAFASVYLDGTNYGVAANSKGEYVLKNIPSGKYTLVVSSLGFESYKKEIKLKNTTQLEANVELQELVTLLPEVVVMVGGEEKVKETPGSVVYIAPKELEKFSYTDVNRTLRLVPGVNIQEEDGFGLRPNIGLRGTGVERSSKITIMEDGVLMAPAPYAAPSAYYFPTIGRMQGVEVLKGSAQIKHGPYTTGGAINFLSTPVPNEFSGQVSSSISSFNGRNLHVNVGHQGERFGFLFETFQYGSDGFKEMAGFNTGFDKEDYLLKLKFNSAADAKIQQSVQLKMAQTSELSNETYLGLTAEGFNANPYQRYLGSQKDQMTAKQRQLSLNHTARLSNAFSLTTTIYRNEFSRNWYKLDKVADSANGQVKIASLLANPEDYQHAMDVVRGDADSLAEALYVKANNRKYFAQGIQSVLSYTHIGEKAKHKVNLGLRFHQDGMDRFQWVDTYAMEDGIMKLHEAGEPGTESNRIELANAFASYVQYELDFGALKVKPGLRYENITISRVDYGKNDPDRTESDLSTRSNEMEVLIPGIGFNYLFNEKLAAFAGVHRGFAPAGSTEGAEAEESVNYELGVRANNQGLKTEVVLFMNDYKNLLGSDMASSGGTGNGDMFNAGEVLTRGLEAQAAYNLLSKGNASFALPLQVNYTYTSASFQNTFDSDFWGSVEEGDAFPYLAAHQLGAGLSFQKENFAVNANFRYNSAMRISPGTEALTSENSIPAHGVLDMSAHYQINNKVKVFGSVNNLANNAYLVAMRPAGLRPGLPRNLSLGIKASF